MVLCSFRWFCISIRHTYMFSTHLQHNHIHIPHPGKVSTLHRCQMVKYENAEWKRSDETPVTTGHDWASRAFNGHEWQHILQRNPPEPPSPCSTTSQHRCVLNRLSLLKTRLVGFESRLADKNPWGFYPIVSYHIISPILSYPIPYPIISYPTLSYPILSCQS
jgi:hypothetical protein